MTRPLVVVALAPEAAHLDASGLDADILLTGPGKVSAAVAVAKAISTARPSRVLVAGTAGALREGLEGTHVVGRVMEHDFDRESIAALVGEPLPGEVELDPSSPIVLATGDQFIHDDEVRRRLAARADLVDMEAYAVVRVCQAFGVPCQVIKVVSDTASEGALRTWQDQVDQCARLLAEAVARALS